MNPSANDTLRQWIPAAFPLSGRVRVTLLRSYTNDVYLVKSGPERFVLKLYGAGWRRDSEVRYEIELLHHLDARGIRVAIPIAGIDGETLHHIAIDGTRRQVVAFAHADGEKPKPPFTIGMYRRQGMATAALHRAADSFTSHHDRSPQDLVHLIYRPLELIESLDLDAAARQSLTRLGTVLTSRITELAERGLDWGPCHGDLTFDNVHITDAGETVWYDFDSGGPGWRAIDLQGWALALPERHADWHAFLDGYRTIRPLNDIDIEAAPLVWLALQFWGVEVDLRRRFLTKGMPEARRWLTSKAARLRGTARAMGVSF